MSNNTEAYYKKAARGLVDKTVKESLQSDHKEVVYGAQSVNARMPSYLQKFTEDWDIYSHKPEETAHEMEKLLDAEFNGDFFEVKPAKHEGTFKVISKVTKRGIADITLPDKSITYRTIDGINYATLDEQVANIRRALADPEYRFRWDKDKEALQRIELFKRGHPEVNHIRTFVPKGVVEEQRRELGEDEELKQWFSGKPKKRRPTRPSVREMR